MKNQTFHEMGIADTLLSHMNSMGFKCPTPIQTQAIPVGIEGRDIVGVAETGTGKTLSFLVPMLHTIDATGGRGLILVPTRELAQQVYDELNKLARPLNVVAAVIVGGVSMHGQLKQLKRNPHVIIATPGRLIDHMEQKTINLSDVSSLILDEADRMMDMGFLPQIEKVLKQVPDERQTMLFSATMPGPMRKIVQKYLKNPCSIEIARAGKPGENIEQRLYVVDADKKLNLLQYFLAKHKGHVLVFTRTKYGAKKLARKLNQMGHKADELHSNRTQAQRKRVMDGYRRGKFRVLVATDIAARGLDVDDIELVVNYDLPDQAEDYVHRIGRTGRAGNTGIAASFATRKQRREVRDIENVTKQSLPITNLPELPSLPEFGKDPRDMEERGQRRGGNRSYGRNRSGGNNRRSSNRSGGRSRSGNRNRSRSRSASKA